MKTKKRNAIYYMAMVFALAVMLFIPSRTAQAAGSSISTAPAMKVGSKVSGIMKGNKHYYKFSVSSNSIIYFDLRTGSRSQSAGFSIRNSKGSMLDGYNYYTTSQSSALSFQQCRKYMSLNAGTYYIELSSANCSYTLQTSLIAKTTSGTKIAGYSNNSVSNALPISIGNRIYSVSYGWKMCHYYRFTLSSRQTVKFVTKVLSTDDKGISCFLLNSSGKRLTTIASNATKTSKKTYSAVLSAGTYYISVWDSNCSGRYTITTSGGSSSSKKAQVISAPNVKTALGVKPFTLKASVTTGDGKLSYSSSNQAVAVISSAGKVTVKGVGTTTITITASETSAYKKTTKKITIKVYPKATVITQLVSETSKKMLVRWSSVSGSTGYHVQYADNASFNSPKAYYASSAASGVRFSNVKTGTRYYVRVRTFKKVNGVTYYSKWSTVKSVVVK